MELSRGRKAELQLVGYRMTRLRRAKGVTQADVANILGLQQGNYARFESGFGRLMGKNLEIVARYFNVPKDYLDSSKMKLNFLSMEALDILFTPEFNKDVKKLLKDFADENKDKVKFPRTVSVESIDDMLDSVLR